MVYELFQMQVECSELQKDVSEELWLNSERLRTLTFLRRDEKKLQDRLQKNHWLLVSHLCYSNYSSDLHISIR